MLNKHSEGDCVQLALLYQLLYQGGTEEVSVIEPDRSFKTNVRVKNLRRQYLPARDANSLQFQDIKGASLFSF